MTQGHPTSQDRQHSRREDVRFRLLHALDSRHGLSQRGLARETGASLGAVNALLNGLIGAELVNVASPMPPPARFSIAYTLTDTGKDEVRRMAGRYLVRRRAERAALDTEIANLDAIYGPPTSSQG